MSTHLVASIGLAVVLAFLCALVAICCSYKCTDNMICTTTMPMGNWK